LFGIELECVRQRHAFRRFKPRAAIGDIAHDAIHAREPVVEINAALDEGLVSGKRAALDHGDSA